MSHADHSERRSLSPALSLLHHRLRLGLVIASHRSAYPSTASASWTDAQDRRPSPRRRSDLLGGRAGGRVALALPSFCTDHSVSGDLLPRLRLDTRATPSGCGHLRNWPSRHWACCLLVAGCSDVNAALRCFRAAAASPALSWIPARLTTIWVLSPCDRADCQAWTVDLCPFRVAQNWSPMWLVGKPYSLRKARPKKGAGRCNERGRETESAPPPASRRSIQRPPRGLSENLTVCAKTRPIERPWRW